MSLPYMSDKSIMNREVRTEWGGLNLNESAGDGELVEAMNMSSREFPILATAAKPALVRSLSQMRSPVMYDQVYYVHYVNNQAIYFISDPDEIADSRKISIDYDDIPKMRYGIMNRRIYMVPNKQYYDVSSETIGNMEALVSVTGAEFEDGTIGGVPAEANTLFADGADWGNHYKVGDAVTISGSNVDENNGTFIIREISGDYLRFYEYTFTNAANQTLNVSRTVPDMDFVCVNENRLWGCKGDMIYASALGDPLNFNVFDGVSTDSWATETGTEGDFTACVSYQGYPVFFKRNAVFRIVGDSPQNFQLRKQSIAGVDERCDLSIAEVRGVLYYQSPVGIVGWAGGDYPSVISEALDIDFTEILVSNSLVYPNAKVWAEGIAGTDGARYYISLTHKTKRNIDEFITVNSKFRLFVYDTRYGTWHEMTDTSTPQRTRFLWNGVDARMIMARYGDGLTVYDEFRIPGDGHTPRIPSEKGTEWAVTFADSTRVFKTVLTGSESKKGVLRLLIRCKLAGSMKVWLSYDGGAFEEAKEIGGEDGAEKSSYVVPLILRRCDFWQLRLTGTDDAVIYSLAVERYGGEWQQAK